jgi:DNA-binding transcriptional MerR regulator/methylmalonyl-CoA mutase cobalamin-binding subunit
MTNSNELLQSIRVVAAKTGLSAHVIRVWEKRYGAVTPGRSGTNRRLYSETEVDRLNLLRQATTVGHSISNIAKLSDAQLRRLSAEAFPRISEVSAALNGAHRAPQFVESCLNAVSGMDAAALTDSLNRALVALGHQGLLQRVVAPLAHRVGELWREGLLTAAHEHFLSATVKAHLGSLASHCSYTGHAPCLVVATPAGQLHELGAVLVHAAAANLGWRVVYLGASLPAADIAGAAVQHRAAAVALSLVYPEDDLQLAGELRALRRFLPPETGIIAGGRAARAFHATLNEIGAILTENLEDLAALLDGRRRNGPDGRGAAESLNHRTTTR